MTGEEYSQRLLQYFEDMINLQVTHSIYYPRDFRGTRDHGPEPYDGASDIDEFERWLVHNSPYGNSKTITVKYKARGEIIQWVG